ncbi:hypothetical protein [Streptomyces sp. NPDC094149]
MPGATATASSAPEKRGDLALELLGDVGVPVLPGLQDLGHRGGFLPV